MLQKNVGKKIYKTGGAQTMRISLRNKKFEKVDKIVGPGNAFVACAKKKFLEMWVLIWLQAHPKLALLRQFC